MEDLAACWKKIVCTLANVEASRLFARPLIILAHEQNTSSPPGLNTQVRQKAVAAAMIAQANVGTKQYLSGHHMPLVWGVRVDEDRDLGLVFVQLELKIESRGALKQAYVRLVTSKRHAEKGWAIETKGTIGSWRGARRILESFVPAAPIDGHRTFNPITTDNVPNVIDALIREADRIHWLLRAVLDE